jgi:hypothetical protein
MMKSTFMKIWKVMKVKNTSWDLPSWRFETSWKSRIHHEIYHHEDLKRHESQEYIMKSTFMKIWKVMKSRRHHVHCDQIPNPDSIVSTTPIVCCHNHANCTWNKKLWLKKHMKWVTWMDGFAQHLKREGELM